MEKLHLHLPLEALIMQTTISISISISIAYGPQLGLTKAQTSKFFRSRSTLIMMILLQIRKEMDPVCFHVFLARK